MPAPILIFAALGLLCLLIGAAQQTRRTLPDPKNPSPWRDGDVLTREDSIVDLVQERAYTSAELFGFAAEAREAYSAPAHVSLLHDLAYAARVSERLSREQAAQRRERRAVRVLARVVGA